MKKWWLLFLFAWCLPAYAQQPSAPIMYSKDSLTIIRQSPPALPLLPWQDASQVQFTDPAAVFSVEVRDAASLYHQQGWFNLDGLQPNNGVLLIFQDAGIWPLTKRAQYAPLDILFVDVEGKIIQIVPSLKLADLQQDILPASRVKAFLLLNGGASAQLSVKPGDYVSYSTLFRRPPTVLGTPQPVPEAPPVVPVTQPLALPGSSQN